MPVMLILKKIGSMFINKKRVVGWVAAVVLAAAAVATDMSIDDLKEAIAGAPNIQPIEKPAESK